MALIWNKKMSVANDAIDHDHHFMINFVNTIELLLNKKEDSKHLLDVFDQLHEYSIKHFRREESIQRKIEFPKSLHHKNSHSKLLKELEDLQKELKDAKSSEEISGKANDIIKFLRHWLVNHVLDEDLLLKPYLEKLPRGFT